MPSSFPAALGAEAESMAELRRRLEWREAEFETTFDGSPIGLLLLDRRLLIRRLNQRLAGWIGAGAPDHSAGSPLSLVAPELAATLEPDVARVFATGQATADHELTWGSGPLQHASVSCRPIFTREGDVRLVVVTIRDVTELRLARAALERQAEFEAVLLDFAERLFETPAGRLDHTVRGLLSEVCKFLSLSRAAVVRFVGGSLLEATHHSPRIDGPGLLEQIRSREARWLNLVYTQLSRVGQPVVEPRSDSDVRVQGTYEAPRAFAVPVVRRELWALVCHPSSNATRPTKQVLNQAKAVARLAIGALATERARRAEVESSRVPRPSSRPGTGFGRTLIGSSPVLQRVLESLEAVAPTEATVLIHGESGVGKELIARTLHEKSRRSAAPLVTVNCASIPRELFESEFFGHVRGAFSGAHRDRAGRFELADGGTLFLDEVAEIPLELQSKLLRVLQEDELNRIGDHVTRRVDVRIVAATNRDLEKEVAEGRFREDLYYRLNVFPIHVPALRERPDDILVLARHFLEVQAAALGRHGLVLDEEHAQVLLGHHWPGNVRELHNVIERAVIQSIRPPLRLVLAFNRERDSRRHERNPRACLTAAELREQERSNMIAALIKSEWRVSGKGGAAELLGMRPSTLRDRMNALGIRRP